MDVQITVRVCDICKRQDRPAIRYTLKPEHGEAKTRDLCAEDVAPVEAVFGLLERADNDQSSGPLYLNADVEDEPTTRRKRTGKKAAATPGQRRTGRTKVMTLEEIEAMKTGASQS
ncbi:hypothetical protein [Streptomyces sp. NPDC019507]|uniref:hypothetical protein n=1 Tax=Streptomyces sp. NPDC019507 TaxID=3154689 RepID=UPI00340FBF32